MRRHSLCALEGDIHIKNLLVQRHEDSEYLIPSFLMLKKKVERLFGVQPSASLTQDRSQKADYCSSVIGKAQFELYARELLKQNHISLDDTKSNIESESEIETVNESLLSNGTFSPEKKAMELMKLQQSKEQMESVELKEPEEPEEPEKPVLTESMKQVSLKRVLEWSDYEFPKKMAWRPLFSEGSTLFHRYRYSIKVPSRDTVVLKQLMLSYQLPHCHYDDIVMTKEFNTQEILNRFFGSYESGLNSNRLQFWQDIIEPPRLTHYRRFLYNIKPPQIKGNPPPTNFCSPKSQSSLNTSAVFNSSITQYSENETSLVIQDRIYDM